MTLYIADIHFGHENVIEFDQRPFNSVEEMDLAIINNWNSEVSPRDDVWVAGDLMCYNKAPEEWYLKQLNGHIHLIIGNHDNKLLKNDKAMSYIESVDKMAHVKDDLTGKHIHICHFPMIEWNGMYHGTWHIYGHIHCAMNDAAYYMAMRERALNCGACIVGYKPVNFNTLVKYNKIHRQRM